MDIIEEVSEATPGTILRSQPAVGNEVEVGARVHLITALEPTEVPTEVVVLEPDLVVYRIEPVDRNTVRCYFQNVGDKAVPYQEIFLVVELMGDRVSNNIGLDSSKFPLIPGDEDYADVNVAPISESVDARCFIDDTNTVDETDEGNNDLVQRLEVLEQRIRLESIVIEDGRITNEGGGRQRRALHWRLPQQHRCSRFPQLRSVGNPCWCRDIGRRRCTWEPAAGSIGKATWSTQPTAGLRSMTIPMIAWSPVITMADQPNS